MINELVLVTGATCELKSCRAHFNLPEPLPFFEGREAVREIGEPLGWSLWAGRSQRIYCPKHGPSRELTMNRVW